MCGIAGILDSNATDLEGACRRMTDALAHRGPDDAGYSYHRDVGLALGHRRLSIVDLSPAGHQPMRSGAGRYEIVFNGEIYNHDAIRAELQSAAAAPAWRGHSDTETLLAAIDAWGVRGALERCVGMFAFALWDRERRRLTLVRDRAGEKPLYYGRCGRAFVFASGLQAIQAHPAFRGEVDRGSLALYLRHCYVPDPHSIFVSVKKLPAGSLLEIDEAGRHADPVEYWTAVAAIAAARTDAFAGDDAAAVDALERVLAESVRTQMIADVPLGAFLSGGIDSSLIVALMQRQSTRPVRTFTIGFTEPQYDESGYARAVATHLGTDHSELIVTPAETRDVIPRLPVIYDEPFGDSSQIPTFLVSQLARRSVTVALSGDAGDELFGGYGRYFRARRLWRNASRVPAPLRRALATSIRARSPQDWTRLLGPMLRLLPGRLRARLTAERLGKVGELMGGSRAQLYRRLISHWTEPEKLVVGGFEPESHLVRIMSGASVGAYEEEMMYWDLVTYLPGDILVKVDRAAMAVSLETRVPMLDRRVIEFAWSLPLSMRVRGDQGKWLLRQLLERYVPRKLTDRPKTGFGIPIDIWLRGPLRDWAESLLDESRLRREGLFAPELIRACWLEHCSGRRDWAYWLWDVLMFQAWQEAQTAQRNAVSCRTPVEYSPAIVRG